MTAIGVQPKPRPMAPKQFIDVHINLPLPQDMKDRIDAALIPGEKRTAFIREAIDEKLKRRERRHPRKTGESGS